MCHHLTRPLGAILSLLSKKEAWDRTTWSGSGAQLPGWALMSFMTLGKFQLLCPSRMEILIAPSVEGWCED